MKEIKDMTIPELYVAWQYARMSMAFQFDDARDRSLAQVRLGEISRALDLKCEKFGIAIEAGKLVFTLGEYTERKAQLETFTAMGSPEEVHCLIGYLLGV